MRGQSSTPDPHAPASWDAYNERLRHVVELQKAGADPWPMCGWGTFKRLIEMGKWDEFVTEHWPGDERMRMEGES